MKIYGCYDAPHASFVEAVTQRPELDRYFPEIVARHDRFITASWVTGHRLTRRQLLKNSDHARWLAELCANLHTSHLDDPGSPFDYAQYLLARVEKLRGVLPIDEAIAQCRRQVQGARRNVSPRISHPDITPANLVWDGSDLETTRLVDNELLNHGWYFGIDLLVLHAQLANLTPQLPVVFLSHYATMGGPLIDVLQANEPLSGLWRMRQCGRLLEAGRPHEALQTVTQDPLDICAEFFELAERLQNA